MKGFLTLAQNGTYDYVKMAYVLAMSLKLSQQKYNKLSVIVNKGSKIPSNYKQYFDKIIYVDDPEEEWKINNKWRYFQLSPYDETIVLDTDMLFFHDITTWWDVLQTDDISFTTNVKNYRNETVTSDYYRKVFTENKLPNLYTALFYFKKTNEVEQYFKFLRIIFENWEDFYEKFLQNKPRFLSGDVAFALGAKLFFNRKWESTSNILTFTHMRSRLQDETIFDNWNKILPVFFTVYNNKIQLKVNNFNQMWPFHYIQKDFLSEEVIKLYEEISACVL